MGLSGNIARLVDACCEAVSNPDWQPSSGTTFCNFAVNFIAARLGYQKFKNLNANEITGLMETNGEWLEVAPDVAEYHATHGALVVAGQKNLAGHGHVCVVRPGELGYSSKWHSMTVPKVANIGQENFIDKGANWAFGAPPKYYALKEMI